MRDDSYDSFDEHQLAAVVHLVLFHRKDHLEAALRWDGRTLGHLNALGEEIVAGALEPFGPLLTVAAEEFDCLSFRARRLLVRGHLLHESWKIESLQRCAALDGLNLVLEIK